jgi:hypothetical protein
MFQEQDVNKNIHFVHLFVVDLMMLPVLQTLWR